MISIIVAHDINRVIGNKGRIPWNIPEDLHHFRDLTTDNVVIMGRRTYEEIGRPLPHRHNIIITSNEDMYAPGCVIKHSLKEAVDYVESDGDLKDKEIFICGGAMLYKEALGMCDRMYVTYIQDKYEGDTYFPEYDPSDYKLVSKEQHDGFAFIIYE